MAASVERSSRKGEQAGEFRDLMKSKKSGEFGFAYGEEFY